MSKAPQPAGPPSAPLEEASRDELLACVRLLATSVADHRERFGSVAMDLSARHLDSRAAAALTPLDEALALVRIALPPASGDAPAAAADLRRQHRINLHTAVAVQDDARTRRVPAELRNISWGGAALRCPAMPAAPGEHVWLELPAGFEREIPVRAEVLRRTRIGEIEEYGLRFVGLDPADEPRFRRVLEILLEQPDGDGRRVEPRLVQRLEIEYGDAGELRATLEDISAGGLQLVVPDPLELQQTILIVLSSADTARTLELRARVVHQACEAEDGVELYRVGLAFEHADDALRAQLGEVIRALALQAPPRGAAPVAMGNG
ncbi:MAG: PilZ domain-containing protein [Gammaproteobacteria bacterium]|nr:PilZ domain-containing protein [Gammaproteobacteria bacterium]MCP5199737.1 PilZ domain-containing protein [Gammaproteobacteria bacterium]